MDIYVLDTSALISDPNAFMRFANKTVVIPITVISELDTLKKRPGDTGKSARVCIKRIEKISNLGDIDVGILLDNGSLLRIDVDYSNLSSDYSRFGPLDYGDTQILVTAYELNKIALEDGESVTLVSNDLDLRIKAKAFGLNAEGCQSVVVNDFSFSGFHEIVDVEMGNQLSSMEWVDPEEVSNIHGNNIHVNEFVLFTDTKSNGLALGRKIADDSIVKIDPKKPWGISSKNKHQACAIDLLMDPEIKLVTLLGKAGTGKSIITLAAGLEQVINKKVYKKLIIYRPVESVGKEIGFLPGDVDEKLAPYFANINDSFEYLLGNQRQWEKDLEMWKTQNKIQYSPITYIRGRSINNALIIVDEAQNLSADDLKTVLTRAGVGTKIILNGDIEQIDNNDLDLVNNGLSYVADKFKDSDLAGTITLIQGERSALAEEATNLL